MKKINIICYCYFLFSVSVFSQSSFLKIFNRFEFSVKNTIEDVFTDDLNKDNLEDLLVVTESSEKREMYIYFQKRTGYSSKPDQILSFDRRAIFFDFGDITDIHKGKEIVCLTKKSIFYYYFKDGLYQKKPERLMELSSIFQSTSKECPVRTKFIFNVKNENSSMILIPNIDDMILYKRAENGEFKKSQKRKIKPHFITSSNLNPYKNDSEHENFSQKVNIRVPRIYLKDFNGDKTKDILSIYEDKIKVFFFNNVNGRYSVEPDFEICLEVLTKEEKERLLKPFFYIETVDLNNNGLMDIIVTKAAVKVTSSMTKIYIYLNKKGKIGSTPDQIMILDNTLGYPRFEDLNNDGFKDLIVDELNMGLFQLIKILITNKASFKENIYLRKEDRYGPKADFKLKGNVRFDLEISEKNQSEFMCFDGDFTGDSVKDFFKTNIDKDKICIFKGNLGKKNLYSKNPDYESKESILPGDFIIKDLNGDKIQDVIFDYRKIKMREKHIVILLSKGKK